MSDVPLLHRIFAALCLMMICLLIVFVIPVGIVWLDLRFSKRIPAHQYTAHQDTVHQDTVHQDTANLDSVHYNTVHQDMTHRETPHRDNDRVDKCLSDFVNFQAEIRRLLDELSLHHVTREELNDIIKGQLSEISSIGNAQKQLLSSHESIKAHINDVDDTCKEQRVMTNARINNLDSASQNQIASVYNYSADAKQYMDNALNDIEKKLHSIEEKIEKISHTIIEAGQHINELDSTIEKAEILLKVLHRNSFDKGSIMVVIVIISTCQAGLILIVCTSWNSTKTKHIKKHNPEEGCREYSN